jgi:GH24 family phage-related lysozyme (muramidase)
LQFGITNGTIDFRYCKDFMTNIERAYLNGFIKAAGLGLVIAGLSQPAGSQTTAATPTSSFSQKLNTPAPSTSSLSGTFGQRMQSTPQPITGVPNVPTQPPTTAQPSQPAQPSISKPKLDIFSILKKHEGFRPTSYLDHLGHNTVGYGSTNQQLLSKGTISEPEAAGELTNHVNKVIANLRTRIGTNTFNNLPDQAKVSLEDLGYQTGDIGKWPHLLKDVQAGNFTNAANDIQNSLVNSQTPGRNAERINWMRQAAK